MYTVRQASLRSGVSIPLLHAWERRYGVVAPERTASGYRLYDQAAIDRLTAMRRLVDAGWGASQAAAEVLRSTPEEVIAATGGVGTARDGAARASEAPAVDRQPRPDLVAAAERYDSGAIELVLDDIFSRGSYEAVVDDLVLPAVGALGTGWATGRLDIAAEHLASEAVQRRLASLFNGSSVAGTGLPVIVGLPPGNLHEIGTIAFAVALRRRGLDVLYLGPDVPLASWLHAVETRRPRAAVLGVARPEDLEAARAVAVALLAASPNLVVAVGGPVATAAAASPAEVLAPRVADAAHDLARRLAAGSS